MLEFEENKIDLGKFSQLDRDYEKFMNKFADNIETDIDYELYELQDMVIKNLIKDENHLLIKEIKYRITDGEDMIYVLLDAIKKDDNLYSAFRLFESRLNEILDY